MENDSHRNSRPPSFDAILEAAVAEFAERGRDGVRMEKVAERAGLNKSLVYRHFKNREKLFEAALEAVFADRFKLLEDLPVDLVELFDLWSKRFKSNPLFVKMLLRESLELDREQPIHAELRRRYYQHQIASIKRLQEDGELPSEFDDACLFLMLTAVLVFPYLLPQIATLITGNAPESVTFQRKWKSQFQTLLSFLKAE